MRKSKGNKRENGAVAVISMFIMTTLILLTAIVVDYGLFEYKANKLQGAVDSAATAVAANLDATTATQVGIAKSYLEKNGFVGDDIEITVEHKGVLDEATAREDDYITAGYMKVTVDTNEGMIFSEVLNKDSMRLIRTAYAKCNANYDEKVPEALKYTLIAGSQSGTATNPAVEINGRTGDITNMFTSMLEGFINGVNTSLVQPIKELFGFEGDYTDLVHINTSEVVTNGDVHSNSNIDIAVQALNVSRMKDDGYEVFLRDEDGNLIPELDEYGNPVTQEVEELVLDDDGNPIPIYETDNLGNKIEDENGNYIIKKDKNGNNMYETVTVSRPVYKKTLEYENYEDNGADDYGQVTYTAVDSIRFTNSSFDASTHVYTQNQQYLEQTQVALNILNELDFSTIGSTSALKTKYNEGAYNYFAAHPGIANDRRDAILAQANNLSFENSTKTVTLNNQSMIVYDISHDAANAMLNMVESGDTTIEDLYTIIGMDYDPLQDESGNLLYKNTADNEGTIEYSIVIEESDYNSAAATVNVSGLQVNRDYEKTGAGLSLDGLEGNSLKTFAGASFSIANTFRSNLGESGYISLPNLKPYFVREVNKSIRNATKSREELGDDEAKGQTTVKNAVKKLGEDLSELLDSFTFTDSLFKDYNTVTDDEGTVKYESAQELKDNAQSQLFTKFKESSTSGLTDLTGTQHTTYKGFELFNEDNLLKTPTDFINEYAGVANTDYIDEFAKNNITENGSDDEGAYGIGAYNAFYNDYILNNSSDSNKYDTNYGDDAVQKKRDEIEATLEKDDYGARKDEIDDLKDDFKNKAPVNKMYDIWDVVYKNHVDKFISENLMPTVLGLTVTMKADLVYSDRNIYWADGSQSPYTFTKTTMDVDKDWLNRWERIRLNNCFINGNISESVSVCLLGPDRACVNGDLSVNDSSKAIDVGGYNGNNGTNATLVVTGNMKSDGTLQVRKNSIVYCEGNITCKDLYMEEGAKIYCGGKLTVTGTANTAANTTVYSKGLSLKGSSSDSNNATYYCFGDFTGDNTYLKGNGSIYVAYNANVTGNLTAAGGFKFITDRVLTATNITAITADSDASVIRGLWEVVIDANGTFTTSSTSANNKSEIFCGEDTQIPVTCSYVVGGDIYFPEVDKNAVLKPNQLLISNYGELFVENEIELSWIYIENGGSLYVTQQAYLVNCHLTNNGKAYFLGGLDVSRANVGTGDSELQLSNTSDLFIGENSDQNLILNGYYLGRGNVYIENNLTVKGFNNLREDYVSNRGETFVVVSGVTHVSGNTSVSIDDGVYVGENCAFSTGGDFNFGSAIYNLGKFIVYGDMVADENAQWYTDKGSGNMNEGISIANGGKTGVKTAVMFVGGDKATHLRGYIINNGTLVHNGGLDVDGYRIPEDKTFEIYIDAYWTRCNGSQTDYAPHISISNYQTAQLICVGNIDTQGAIYNYQASKLSSQGHIYYGMAIMNGGEFVAVDGISYSENHYVAGSTDYIEINGSSSNGGYSIVNGYNGSNWGFSNAILYAGANSNVDIGGAVQNYGKIYIDTEINVKGFIHQYSVTGHDTSIINHNNAEMHIGGKLYANSNAVYNGENSSLTCGDDLEFGIGLYNNGRMIVLGLVTNDESKTTNNRSYKDSDNFSLRNGYDKNNKQYTNAVLYAGEGIRLGVSEHGNAGAGTLQNGGTLYCGGDCFVFTNEGNCHKKNAFLGQLQSNTFIKGDYFGGGGTTIMNNSIFMVGDDFHSKRAAKFNSDNTMTYNIDNYELCYVYVGGNMLVNTIGYDLDGNNNPFRSFDIYSNTNIYVGGSVYMNSILNMCQNVTFVIGGNKDFTDEYSTYSGAVSGNDMDSDGKVNFVDLIRKGVSDSKNLLTWPAVDEYVEGNYKLIVTQSINNGKKPNALSGLTGYGDSGIGATNTCSTLIVNGSAFVRDECKLRDMDKTYIFGDFTCTDYVEIGKALDGKDETEAKTDLFKEEGENDNDYEFANAGYMYVGGDYYSQKYNKIYASTTLKVLGDYVNGSYLTLRHDANIYVGKKLRATTSIDAGSYSNLFVGGSMEASTSTIKIRDNVTCFVGGNMTALSYIELGKFGDYTRNIIAKANMSAFPDPNAEGSTYKSGYLYRDDSTGNYYYYSQLDEQWKQYSYKSEVVDALEGDGGNYDGDEGESSGDDADAGNEDNQGQEEGGSETEIIGSTTTLDTEKELAADDSDLANGSTIYIGKTLVSYMDYIKEFAYSQVAVGNYVYAPDYITLRHNADLWVMPETFDNETYTKKVYPDAQNIWQLIVNKIDEFVENFRPKNGSIYTLGELTLNKNASLMGTWDCVIQGKCTLRPDSLVYMGHDFILTAPSLNLTWDAVTGKESVCGFDTYGTSTGNTSFPVVVYADNDINIMTTVDMKLTYLVANRGDVQLYDIYSRSENAERNAKALPNAICSYSGDVSYFSMYGKLGALMYCPNGSLNLDGYYMEIWGSGVADTIETNTYYLSLHRFTNWRTLDLQLATSGSIFLVSEKEYEDAVDNVDDIFMFDQGNSSSTTDEDFVKQGASLFFDED